ncbi:hypothetical protein L6164_023394 [Bauhinia variegata]|uniref:Uncharacterized protein n=1 Tax=Bauhinia variegata TaxID=167791 RepID=A0ACB9MK22_BAUVA|nr:hypothetical protein L6164_023394 [Bauhinia variegata]
MLETILGALLQVVFDRIVPGGNVSRWISSFFGRKDADDAEQLFNNLKMLLLSVKAVLGNAEEKQIVDPNVKAWVDMVGEVVYDADEIASIALPHKLNHKSQTNEYKLVDYLSSFRSRLEKINKRLTFIVNLKDVLGLREGNGGKASSLSICTTCAIDDSEVYGRDGDGNKIIELLLSRNVSGEKVFVVAIVGMAGVGKTTLSQLLFNDEQMKRHFDLRSWVFVSEGSDPFEVTKKV